MFTYNKKLQYPVKIANPNPQLAKIILTQYGGPDGELGASLRYLSQRYSMPFDDLKGLLTDIGTEELGHLEMIGAIVHQLTRNLKEEQMRDPAFAPYFVDHTASVYPASAGGTPWSAATMQVKGDPMTDLVEDMAAEAAPRSTILAFCRYMRTQKPLRRNGFSFLKWRPHSSMCRSLGYTVDPLPTLVDTLSSPVEGP